MLALSVMCPVAPAGDTTSAPSAHSYPYTNRLIRSHDPYLLLHAHNPVDWYPWGPEALAKAKRENKPIFVSIGYSTCYWCHIAEREIYSNPRIAALMNRWFINIKVDREERPDIDALYMLARQIITGNGSWPNNVFLTPDLKPFYAGSYFPPADDPEKGAGFPSVLKTLHDSWVHERPQVNAVAEEAFSDLKDASQRATHDVATSMDVRGWLTDAGDTLLQQADHRHGGFTDSGGTRFPRSPELGLLLTDYRVTGNEAALGAVRQTLDAMAYGGIHDQLGGGFHRYSTEPTWSIPHFEKMLGDNAQLLGLYARMFQLTAQTSYRDQAFAIAQYLGRDMIAADGGFYSAQDAEVGGVEGASYLWTRAQIAAVLGASETERFLQAYELTAMPEPRASTAASAPLTSDDPAGVLRVRLPVDGTDASDIFAADRARLLAVRAQRPQPARDEKILSGLNGLAIGALAQSGQLLQQPQYIVMARLSAQRIWSLAYDPRRHSLQHEIFEGRAQTAGFLQDYALLGTGLLQLAQATGDDIWRQRARMLADDMLHRFARTDGSLSGTADEATLLVPIADDGDTDIPSGTSAAIELLQLCSTTFKDARYANAAYRAARPFSGRVARQPASWPATVVALNELADTDARRAFHVPVTADHVRVSARSSPGDGTRIDVTLQVDEGYHINANPASIDYLIATAVSFSPLKPSKIVYPTARRFQSAFAPEGIDVYEGAVTLSVSFPPETAPTLHAAAGVVSAQACDAQSCLPPSELRFEVE